MTTLWIAGVRIAAAGLALRTAGGLMTGQMIGDGSDDDGDREPHQRDE